MEETELLVELGIPQPCVRCERDTGDERRSYCDNCWPIVRAEADMRLADGSSDYTAFLASKRLVAPTAGFEIDPAELHPDMFPFQRDGTRWGLRKGRSALFYDTGLGKSFCQIEWARILTTHGYYVLMVAPLAVAKQTVREAAKWGTEIEYVREPDAVTWKTPILITNYEHVGKFNMKPFGGVVLDECFVADTPVDTVDGTKPISDVRRDDIVYTAIGPQRVRAIHKRYSRSLVLTSIQGRDIISSPNHLFFTSTGWVAAKNLKAGDCIIYAKDALRMVQGKRARRKADQDGESFLREILLSEVENEPAGNSRQGSHKGSSRANRQKELDLAGRKFTNSNQGTGAYSPIEPLQRPGGQRKNLQTVAGNRPQAARPRRQRSSSARSATVTCRTVRAELGTGIRRESRTATGRISDVLQDRHSKPGDQDRNRSRRIQSRGRSTEDARSQKGCKTTGARVDGVTIYKSDDPLFARHRDETGRVALCDLEIEGHPSFSIHGLLVHNSGILKSVDGKIRTRLIESCRDIPYRLCCSATPAPNDISEIANHAEFLGLMSRTEMLAHFFVHDDSGWRLKGHAVEPFYRWLASWGMAVKRPSDLGYSDDGFILPALTVTPHFVPTDWKPDGYLFPVKLKGISERAGVRKATLVPRVAETVAIVESEPDEQWLIWCGTNDEGAALKAALDAVEIKGNDSVDHKEFSLIGFAEGRIKRMVTKTKIAGHGLNLQSCARVLFCGLNDSWEQYYQAIRRCWRFGQTREVHAHIVLSDGEYPIYENVMRKEAEATAMSARLIQNVAAYERAELTSHLDETTYHPDRDLALPNWMNGRV